MAKPKRALVLSGGGGRGAYQAGVWRFLEEVGWLPDVVTGTSVGSLNAALIGMGWDGRQLEDFWKRIERKSVYRSSLWQQLLASWRLRRPGRSPAGLLDPTPLRRLLEEVIDLESLRRSQIEVITTAVHVATARLRYFDSSQIGIDHLMASCAIPVVFPWQLIDGEPHWDGGLMANTPVGPALRSGAVEVVAVLLAPLAGTASKLPRTRLQALEWAIEISTLGSAATAVEPFIGSPKNPPLKHQSREQIHELEGRRLAVVAPRELLGFHSVLGFDGTKAQQLTQMGYRDAQAQLSSFFDGTEPAKPNRLTHSTRPDAG
ncbi:MAG: patatin-like phospholipase family protein [Acidobacteriota bacterium]